MTKQETVKIVTMIVMSYPTSDKLQDDNTIRAMASVWSHIFKNDDPKLVELAVQKHISTNKWVPSIAEIREQMVAISRPDIIPPDKAWEIVSDGISSNLFSYEPPEFPPLVKRCVKIVGWDNLREMSRGHYAGHAPGSDRTIFVQQYKPMYEREIEKALLPKNILDGIDKARESIEDKMYVMLGTIDEVRVNEQN